MYVVVWFQWITVHGLISPPVGGNSDIVTMSTSCTMNISKRSVYAYGHMCVCGVCVCVCMCVLACVCGRASVGGGGVRVHVCV